MIFVSAICVRPGICKQTAPKTNRHVALARLTPFKIAGHFFAGHIYDLALKNQVKNSFL